MTVHSYTSKEESEFIASFNEFCSIADKLFNVKITKVLYEKDSVLGSLRFNQIATPFGLCSFETDKAYKRRIYSMLEHTITKTLSEDLK